jgi:hypothetical protein
MSHGSRRLASSRIDYVFLENRDVDRNQGEMLPPLLVASTPFARRWRMARVMNDRASHSMTDSSDEYSANSQPAASFRRRDMSDRDSLPSQKSRHEAAASASVALKRGRTVKSIRRHDSGSEFMVPVSRKPVEVDAAEDRRQSSYDGAPEVLSLRDIRGRQCSGEVSASELDVDIEISGAGEAAYVAEQEAPAVETSSAQRCNPANRFSAILECVRIMPTALVE